MFEMLSIYIHKINTPILFENSNVEFYNLDVSWSFSYELLPSLIGLMK